MRAGRPASKAFLKALADARAKTPVKPSRKTSAVSESALVNAILHTLQLKGVWCWRNNSSLIVLPAQAKSSRRVIKGGEAGSPDIFLVLPRDVLLPATGIERFDVSFIGSLCGIEAKTATGKLRASQLAWHAKAERHGVRVGVARSVSEALALVEMWKGGKA